MLTANKLTDYLATSDGFAADNLRKSIATLQRHATVEPLDRDRAMCLLTGNMIDGAKEYSRRHGDGRTVFFNRQTCENAARMTLDALLTGE